MDLLAPRHTPVVAVEAGIIARLFNSKAGGITVYQFDPTTSYAYYYAHLRALRRRPRRRRDGGAAARCSATSAPRATRRPNTPHLHFAIFVLDEDKRWWEGTPVDPFEVLR